jgi:transmembrane 9 superfamily protein 2/4
LSAILPFFAFGIDLWVFLSGSVEFIPFLVWFLLALKFSLLLAAAGFHAIFAVWLSLCAENHRWWYIPWRNAAVLAIAFTLLGIAESIFHASHTRHPWRAFVCLISVLYSLLPALLLFFAAGAVGFAASFWFVRKLYAVAATVPAE